MFGCYLINHQRDVSVARLIMRRPIHRGPGSSIFRSPTLPSLYPSGCLIKSSYLWARPLGRYRSSALWGHPPRIPPASHPEPAFCPKEGERRDRSCSSDAKARKTRVPGFPLKCPPLPVRMVNFSFAFAHIYFLTLRHQTPRRTAEESHEKIVPRCLRRTRRGTFFGRHLGVTETY